MVRCRQIINTLINLWVCPVQTIKVTTNKVWQFCTLIQTRENKQILDSIGRVTLYNYTLYHILTTVCTRDNLQNSTLDKQKEQENSWLMFWLSCVFSSHVHMVSDSDQYLYFPIMKCSNLRWLHTMLSLELQYWI